MSSTHPFTIITIGMSVLAAAVGAISREDNGRRAAYADAARVDAFIEAGRTWEREGVTRSRLAVLDTNLGEIGPFEVDSSPSALENLRCMTLVLPRQPGEGVPVSAWMTQWPALAQTVRDGTLNVTRVRFLDPHDQNLFVRLSGVADPNNPDPTVPHQGLFGPANCATYTLPSIVNAALDGERRTLDNLYQRNAPRLTLARLAHPGTPVTFQAKTSTGTFTGQGTFRNAVCDTLHTHLINTSVTLTGRLGHATQTLLDLTYDPATQAALKRLPTRLTQRFRQDLNCPATPLQDVAAVITATRS